MMLPQLHQRDEHDDLLLQRYRAGALGITPLRDSLRYINLAVLSRSRARPGSASATIATAAARARRCNSGLRQLAPCDEPEKGGDKAPKMLKCSSIRNLQDEEWRRTGVGLQKRKLIYSIAW